MKSDRSLHRDLTALTLLYSTAATLVGSFTIYYLLSLGMPLYGAPLFVGLQMSAVITACLLLGITPLGKTGGDRLIAIAMLFVFLLYLNLGMASLSNLQYITVMIGVCGGIALVFYWLPFNSYLLYSTHRSNRATITSYYSLIWPLVAIFIPLIGGWLIDRFSVWSNIAISSVLIALVAILALHCRLPHLSPFDLRNWHALRGFRSAWRFAFFLNGVIDGTLWIATPLLGFIFADSAMQYGIYLAAFGIAGALATLILSLFSDRVQKRKPYLYAGALILLPCGLLFFVQFSSGVYLILLCLINFGSPMIGTFLFVIMGDGSQRSIESAVISREIYLNLGRIIAVMGTLSFILLGDIRLTLIPITVSSLLLMTLRE